VNTSLCNIIAPLIEKTMIADPYANRVGKVCDFFEKEQPRSKTA